MQEIIYERDWKNHPFLSKLTSRSDFDGDAALTVKDPTTDDFEHSLSVSLEYRIKDGDWIKAPFADSTAFIDEISMAWYYDFSYHPLFEIYPERRGQQTHEWRAVVTK
jgi:hypothetical protein